MKTTHAPRRTPSARPANDRLMLLPEVADYVRRTEATLRYLRHVGGPAAPPLWRQGRRLVAWKSEVDSWLDAQRDEDPQAARRLA
ncbi:hypothetical protein AB0K21_37875 [Streptosporangium sp. NPDC049248]|uniref:helix-turn-helix transcriptional regulator n=1 Tax=Streptosporangium sp. NPDC049248 TaxID=3155651 RepID=UPI003430BB74